MDCIISKQIAKHCDEQVSACPECGYESLTEQSNKYGTWLACETKGCDFETEIDDE